MSDWSFIKYEDERAFMDAFFPNTVKPIQYTHISILSKIIFNFDILLNRTYYITTI